MSLQIEFANLKAEAVQIVDAAIAAKRDLTTEEREANNVRYARMEAIQNVLKDQKKAAQFALDNNDEIKAAVTQTFAAKKADIVVHDSNAQIARIQQYAQFGTKPEQFTVGTSTASGALIPNRLPGYSETLRPSNAFRIGFEGAGGIYMNSGGTENVSLPVWDDTANTASNAVDGASSETAQDPTLTASVNLNVKQYNGKSMWFTEQYINAQSFNVMEYVVPTLAKRIELAEEADWAALVKAATVGETSVSVSGIDYTDIVGFTRSLPLAYRQNKQNLFIVAHPDLISACEKMVDSNGQPILKDGLERSLPTLKGIRYVESENMDAFGASKTLAVVMSLDGTYIRQAGGRVLARYTDYPPKPAQIGFNLFGWSALGFNAAAVRRLVTPAS